jgi:HNH endonuclease
MPLTGTIAPTDFNWYRLLYQQRQSEEANFWTPSAHFTFRAPEFSPFLFKLKSPQSAICGFGFFAQYSPLPDWLAWETFGQANGCKSFQDMRTRIHEIRARFDFKGSLAAPIGCIIVVNPVFFDEPDWIAQPKDWPPRNLRPMRYDLEVGEGARVWSACLERQRSRPLPTESREAFHVAETPPSYGPPMLINPRLGQGAFRIAVTDAYQRSCAVTGEHSLPALEAAHIRPFALDGPHETRNGLLLRSDLHKLFDHGYLAVTPDYRVEVSSRLREEYHNGKSYYPLHGSSLILPPNAKHRPDQKLLEWHLHTVYRT